MNHRDTEAQREAMADIKMAYGQGRLNAECEFGGMLESPHVVSYREVAKPREGTRPTAMIRLSPEFPDVLGAAFGVVGGERGAEFEDFDVLGLHKRLQGGEVDLSGAGGAVVGARILDVVDVKAEEAVAARFQMRPVVDKAEVLFDLRVAGIVPVDEVRAGDFGEEGGVVAFDGEFFERLAVFDAHFDAALFGFGHEFLQAVDRALPVILFDLVTFGGEFVAELFVFGRVFAAALEHFEKFVGVGLHLDAADVEDDKRGFDADGEVERAQGVFVGELALLGALVRVLVEVGCGMIHAHGQRAEIVERGNFDFAGVDGIENAGHEADAGAVAEFGVFEAEVADFAEHGAAVVVAMGIPAGGKGEHGPVKWVAELNECSQPAYLTSSNCSTGAFDAKRKRPGAWDCVRPINGPLQVRIAGTQHGREPRGFFLTAAAFARLFKVPMVTYDFERAFAVDLLFQSPQSFVNGLAFFQFNLCQIYSLPLQRTRKAPSWQLSRWVRVLQGIFTGQKVNGQNHVIQANRLAIDPRLRASFFMELPTRPVTLTVEQIGELNQQLANLRHDVNNKLSLILAAVDVTQYKPQMIDRMMATVAEQPQKIIDAVAVFSAEFEKTFGIKR